MIYTILPHISASQRYGYRRVYVSVKIFYACVCVHAHVEYVTPCWHTLAPVEDMAIGSCDCEYIVCLCECELVHTKNKFRHVHGYTHTFNRPRHVAKHQLQPKICL